MREEATTTGEDGFSETKRKHLCQSQCASRNEVEDKSEKLVFAGVFFG